MSSPEEEGLELQPGSASGEKSSERLLRSEGNYFAMAEKDLDPVTAEALWRISRSGFEDLNRRSISRQNMTRSEYDGDIASPDVLKYVAYNRGDSVAGESESAAGMFFAYTRPEDITWIDPEFFRQQLPDMLTSGAYSYINTIVVEPSQQGLEVGGLLIRSAGYDLVQRQAASGRLAAAVFDHAEANAGLPDYIRQCLQTAAPDGGAIEVEVRELGRHNYYLADNIGTESPIASEKSHLVVEEQVTDEDEQAALWRGYQEVLAGQSHGSPVQTEIAPQEFQQYLEDPSVLKLITTLDNGSRYPLLVARELDKTALSPAFLGQKTERPVWYLMGAGALNGQAALSSLEAVLPRVRELAAQAGAAVVYDHAPGEYELAHKLQAHLGGSEVVDTQHYCMMATTSKS